MIGADAVRAVAVGGLVVSLVAVRTPFWILPCIAFVEGAGSAVFNAAQPGAVRAVVPTEQLPDAAGAQSGRQGAVRIVGPPLGGVLFEAGRALPFLVDACSYVCSTVSLVLMRVRFQEERPRRACTGS
jgi:MFS family permease